MRVDRVVQEQLARVLRAIFANWTATEIVEGARMYPARVSELRNGNLARFSIGRLLCLIAARGYDIEITIRPTKPPMPVRRLPAATVVRYDRHGRPETAA